jgi:predicted Zn-dependent protease
MEILASMDRQGRAPEFLSTHPYPEERIKNIDVAIRERYAFTQNNPQYKTGEAEFRTRFLSKLGAAYPEGYDTSEGMREFAMTRTGE